MATHTAPILDRIVESRRGHVARLKTERGVNGWAEAVALAAAPRDFGRGLSGPGVALIAESKQRSPSGGVLQERYDPASLAQRYAANGAAAVSVLTEPDFFGGHFYDLQQVRRAVDLPVLCKDFILDPVQVMAARAAGADALLLIAAILEDGDLVDLYRLASRLGMQLVVEVHDEAELQRALGMNAAIIGINNRDLTRMETDKGTTARLRPLIPAGRLIISESGIDSRADMNELQQLGVNAALVGEALLRAPDIDAKVRELTGR